MLIPLLFQADNAYLSRDQVAEAKSALAAYRELHAAQPELPDYAWRLSMAAYYVGMHYETDDDAKKTLFLEGRDAGRACLKAQPENPACHFWTAVNLALYGNTVGPLRTLSLIPEVRRLLEETRELDLAFAYGGPQRILGLISQKLPGILGGSNADAKTYFTEAIRVVPDEPMNYLFLARLLFEEMGDTEGALAAITAGLAKGPFPIERLESRESLHELAALGDQIHGMVRDRSLATEHKD